MKVKDENDKLKTNFDKLLGRVKQLESSQEKKNIKLKNLEEKVKNIEVRKSDDKPDKDTNSRSKEQMNIERIIKIEQDQLINKESIDKTQKEIKDLQKNIELKINAASKHSERFIDTELEALKTTLQDHKNLLESIREDSNKKSIIKKEVRTNKNMVSEIEDVKEIYVNSYLSEVKQEEENHTGKEKIEDKIYLGDYDSEIDHITDEDDNDFKEVRSRKSKIKEIKRLDYLTIGDSLVHGIDEKLFHKGKSTKIVSLREKRLKEVTEFITKSSLEPGNIIIYCGSNDLTKGSVEEVNDQFKELIML